MEGKFYTDKSTAFDHLNEDLLKDHSSQTLKMRNQISALAFDATLILFILLITFFIS